MLEKHINTLSIKTEIENQLAEIANCYVFGNCTKKNYEYYFYLNNEKIKADYCFANLKGYSYCEKDDITYQNVEYESKFINYENYKAEIYLFMPIIIIPLSLFLAIKLIQGYLFVKNNWR